MRDIANLTGVSVQTVSNVVNGRGGKASPATRAAIKRAMEELGYQPSSTARGLRTQKTKNLGFVPVDPSKRFLADALTMEVLAGLGDTARSLGFSLLIQPADVTSPDTMLIPVLERRVDGLVLWLSGKPAERRRLVRAALGAGFPFVLLGEPLPRLNDWPDSDAAAVAAENRDGAFELISSLTQRGHRRIVFLAGLDPVWPMIEQRILGYQAALAAVGLGKSDEWIVDAGGWSPESGCRAARELLQEPNPPTAIVAGNDVLAIGVLRGVRDRRLRVPKDVAVAGFDDFETSAYAEPSLTSVALPGYEMGLRAGELLVHRLQNGWFSERVVWLPTSLRERDST
jgi:DNA-binding LacI/PurR family transcriptional regulator